MRQPQKQEDETKLFAKLSKRAMGWLANHAPIVHAFAINKRGAVSYGDIITLGVSLFVMAIVFPLAMTEITGANTTGWETAVVTIFTVLLPILGIISVAIRYLPKR